MATLLILIIMLTLWIAYKISRRHIESCGDKIPGDKSYPIIGNMLPNLITTNPTDIIRTFNDIGRKYQEYGICRGWIGQLLLVGITDPKYIEIIANSPYAVHKGPTYSLLYGSYPDGGVFITSDPAKWRQLRKPLTNLLKKKYIENEYHKVFLKRSRRLIDYIKEKWHGKEIDVKEDITNFTVDSISENLFGVYTNELEDAKFNFLHHIIEYTGNSFSVGASIFISRIIGFLKRRTTHNKFKENKSGAKRFISWIFEERMKNSVLSHPGMETYYPDFLLERQKEQNLSMRAIHWDLGDIVVGGSDTTAIVLSSALLFLAMFPKYQEEAYQEQVAIFGEHSMADPTPENLFMMKCLTRVIKETIRLTIAPLIIKQASGDIHLDKYTIPKGTMIIILIQVICNNERFWEKPDTFHPDHFLPEFEDKRPAYAYPVFGCGPRMCPGIHYGLNSIKVTLSFILRNYRLSTSLKYEDTTPIVKLMREFKDYKVKFEERLV